MAHSAPYLAAAWLSWFVVTSWMSQIHAVSTMDGGSYLYAAADSSPVLEHGRAGHDFAKSAAPKVVEFYDPKCGACQAFRSSYIEVAKKVQGSKPGVEFYGVSCEVHQALCDSYRGPGVPRIYAFPGSGTGPDDGVEVSKGAGTVHFLSARLIKALQTKEEVAADVEKLGSAESPKRRLDEDEDEAPDSGGEEEEEEEDGPEEGGSDASYDPDEEEESVAKPLEDSDVSGDREGTEDLSEGGDDGDDDEEEEKESEDEPLPAMKKDRHGRGPLAQQAPRGKAAKENQRIARDDQKLARDRNPDDGARQVGRPARDSKQEAQLRRKDETPEYIKQRKDEAMLRRRDRDEEVERRRDGQRKEDAAHRKDVEEEEKRKREIEEKHKQSDAYRNTMRHFEAIDREEGTPKGHHYNEYVEERDRKFQEEGKRVPIDRAAAQPVGDRDAQAGAPGPGGRQPANMEERSQQWVEERAKQKQKEALAKMQEARSGPVPIAPLPPVGATYKIGDNNFRPLPPKDSIQVPPRPPRHNLPVGGGANVPNPFNNDPVRAAKFQEYIARRKEILERREKMKHPIKTILGKGPKGAENMGAVHQKKALQNNLKAQYKGPDLRPKAQHHKVGEKVLKRIPIVKRAFKRSKAEETMNDAALSFTRGLLMGVYKTNAPLDYRKKAALLDWFDLLRVSLPPEIGLHELIDTLKYNIDSISERRENLVAVLEKHPIPDPMWSDSCVKGRGGGGFFCGFWKLLHVMSVGFAEQAGGLSLREYQSPNIRTFSPKEAGDVVREYIAHFFNCKKCSDRFLAQYDDCSFERCNRLTDATEDAPAESWREFPLWIWELHNDISRNKANAFADLRKKEGRRAEARKWERDLGVIFPSMHQCPRCVTSSGTWDLHNVYDYLEDDYWTFGHKMDPKLDKLLDYHDVDVRQTTSHGLGAYVLITLILLLAFVAKRHKKVEVYARNVKFGFGGGSKYRDS
ncbi:hypothetical protein ACHAXT_008079 [Thalassiosira profunda]